MRLVPILALLCLFSVACHCSDVPLSNFFCHDKDHHSAPPAPTPPPCGHRGCKGADLDCSGRVDGKDLAIAAPLGENEQALVQAHFGEGCDGD